MSSFWSGLFAPVRDRFSIEELRHLHSILLRNQVLTDSNRDTVVEALRSIGELTVWGDQHDASLVEYFLTENLLGHFHQILLQRSARHGVVAVQVLQTLSILIQNIRNQQTVYYLFSNDHINNIAALRFDFEDDEVLGYYVNLLKTVSMRLNESTVQFFFHAAAKSSAKPSPNVTPHTASVSLTATFPLFTEAVKFLGHRDGMVRAAVKTLALNIFGIPLQPLRDFLTSPPACGFFEHLARYAAQRCVELDRLLSSWDSAAPRMAAALESSLAEIEDIVSYCNDVLLAGVPQISALMLRNLFDFLVRPILLGPLIQSRNNVVDDAALAIADLSGSLPPPPPPVGPLCSLYALERIFYAVTEPQLASFLVAATLGGQTGEAAAGLARTLRSTLAPETAAAAAVSNSSDFLAGIPSGGCRPVVLGMLRGSDAQLAAAAVRLVAAVLSRRSLPDAAAEAVGLLPRRKRRQQELIDVLTREASPPPSPSRSPANGLGMPEPLNATSKDEPVTLNGDAVGVNGKESESAPLPTTADAAAVSMRKSSSSSTGAGPCSFPLAPTAEDEDSGGSPEDKVPFVVGIEETPAAGTPAVAEIVDMQPSMSAASSLRGYAPHSDPSIAAELQDYADAALTTTTAAPNAAPNAAPSTWSTQQGEENFAELICALLAALRSDLMPPLALPVIGWTLHRLLSTGSTSPAQLTAEWGAALHAAVEARSAAAAGALEGPWADAVPALIHAAWTSMRGVLLRTGPGSVHMAAATWVQTVLVHELHWQLGGEPAGAAAAAAVTASNFSVAAKRAFVAVAGCVAALQTKAALETGDVPAAPPPPLPPPPPGNEESELVEGSLVTATPAYAAMPCRVSFKANESSSVALCMRGMTALHSSVDAALPALPPTPALVIEDCSSVPASGFATVVSIAPLMGAAPAVDAAHPQWLHVNVRQATVVLLRLLSTAPLGAELVAMETSMAEGHWVLAFTDGAAAEEAVKKVAAEEGVARNAYHRMLRPLLGLPQQAQQQASPPPQQSDETLVTMMQGSLLL